MKLFRTQKKIVYFRLGFLTLAACYIFTRLWSGSLYSWDEAYYGEVAREIVTEGKGWLTLHYNFHPWFHKPPGFIWLTALAFKLFGIGEFAARFWSAFFGLATIVLVYFFARDIFHSEWTALFSGVALAGFAQFVKSSRMGMMDAPMAFLVLLGIFCFWKGRKDDWYLPAVGIVTGAAFMVKSAEALLIPIIVVTFSLLTGEWKRIFHIKLIIGFLAGAFICLPWHIIEYMRHGSEFIDDYFLFHVLKRTLVALEGHRASEFFYINWIIDRNFPLGIISLFSVLFVFFQSFSEKEARRRLAIRLVLFSAVAIIVLFSIVRTKLSWYIVPAYPFLALAVGAVLDFLERTHRQRLLFVSFVVILLMPLTVVALEKTYRAPDYSSELKEIALSAKDLNPRGLPVILYDINEQPVVIFYSLRPFERPFRESILARVSAAGPVICIMSKHDGFWAELRNGPYRMKTVRETIHYAVLARAG